MKLKKDISFLGVFSIAAGAMISSGIFILPGLAFAKTGSAVFISYLLAGVLGLAGILSVVELSTAMPKAGGDYFFINKTFGPLLGTISGFLGWFSLSLKSAFAVFGISEIIYLQFQIHPLVSGAVLTLFFTLMNIVGVKEAVRFQIILVAGLFILMASFTGFGLPQVDMSYFSEIKSIKINSIIITAGFVFISFGGLLNVANISEEVKNPKKNLPAGIIFSILSVTIFYTAITFILTGTLSPDEFSNSLTPVADSARIIMGDIGYYLIIAASMLAFFTTANAGIMSASRYPMALSRDGLLPSKISSLNKRFNTPLYAVFLTGLVIFLSLLLPLELMVKAASTVILTSYVLTNISVIILRESGVKNYKPNFKAPFYPWLQLFCIVVFTFFIIDLGAQAVEISLALLFLSFCFYMFYGRKKQQKEYVLLYFIKNIADRFVIENTLEDELRDIIIHRDDIEQDNFDQLVREAVVLDIEGPEDFDSVLSRIGKDLAKKSGMSEKDIVQLLQNHVKEFNPAITPFLAIPHVVIDGEDKIFMMVLRSKNGISFSDKNEKVKAVFIIAGTAEKRLLHLKTLASIASLVGENNFQDIWLDAGNVVDLKNILLLNNRKRYK